MKKLIVLSFALITVAMSLVAFMPSSKMTFLKKTYPFLGFLEDLPDGVYWQVNGHAGESNALDIVGQRFDEKTKRWTALKKGVGNKAKKLSDYLIYGTPIYAMADGEVLTCWCNTPENPIGKPHAQRDGCGKKDGEKELCAHHPSCGCTIPRAGNHLNILSPDGSVILYAHLQPGSIPSTLCPNKKQFVKDAKDKSGPDGHNPEAFVPKSKRKKIKKGQFLGRVGHSGASSGPHVHVHLKPCDYPKNLCKNIPILFNSGEKQKKVNNANVSESKWVKLSGQSVQKGDLIRPAKKNPISGKFSGVFHKQPNPSKLWVGAKWSVFLDKRTGFKKDGYILTDIEVDKQDGQWTYSGVFKKKNGPQALYRYSSWNAFVKKWEELKKQKFRLVDIETYRDNGKQYFVGVWQGSNDLPTLWRLNSWDAFTKKWKQLNGKQILIDVETYVASNGQRYYIGVWAKSSRQTALYQYASFADFKSKKNTLNQQGFKLHDYEPFKNKKGKMYYLGIWSKGKSEKLWRNVDWSSFSQQRDKYAKSGYYLSDFERH